MPTLTPVAGDPFAESAAPQPRLTPVEGNPFEQADAAQGAREAAATRVRGPLRPSTGRSPDPSWSDVGKVITQTATGANEGLSSTVLRAADAVPYFASRAMGGEGVHPFEGTFNKTFVEPAGEPTTDAQSIGRAGGRMAGANVENIVPAMGAANSGIRTAATMAEQAAPGLKGVWNTFKGGVGNVADWMAAHPGKALVSDTLGAGQAGAGGEFARETAQDAGATPETQQRAELAGQMLAPMGAAMYSRFGPGALLTRAGTSMAKRGLEGVPEGMLPERLQPAGGTLAERKAEGLAYSNKEGKYANPDEPAPKEPNFVQKQIDAGTEARTAKAGDVVAKQFNKITSEPEAAANLAQTEALKKDIPGFEPGIAKATGDPALLNKQKEFEATATGDELRQRQAATDASRGAIREHMDNAVPQAGEFPQDTVAAALTARMKRVNDKVEGQRGAVGEDIAQRTNATQQRLEGERATTQGAIDERQTAAQQRAEQEQAQARGRVRETSDSLPETDPTIVGNELRETRAGLRTQADAQMRHLRGQVDPSGRAVVELPPATPDGEPIQMSVNAALNRRAQINQDLADHYGASNRDQAAVRNIRQLQEEKNTLDAAIEVASGGDEGLRAYNDYYRNEYAPRFLQGASRDVGRFDRNGYGGNRVSSEDVPGEFFKPNNVSEARQFNQLYGENPEVRQRMTDYALDDLRRTAVDPNTGTIKEGAVNKWLAKNERVLNEMPWIREAVAGRNPDANYQQASAAADRQKLASNPKTLAQVDPEVGPLQAKAGQIGEQQRLASNPKTISQVEPEIGGLQTRFSQLEQRQRAVGDAKVASLLGKTPEQHIDAALNDWQVMKGLRSATRGDPQAEAALTRAVWDRAKGATGKDTLVDAEGLQKWIDGHRRSLAQVLTPQHMNNLETVIKASRVEAQLPRPTGTYEKTKNAFSDAEGTMGSTIPSLGATTSALARGRSSPVYEVPRLLLNFYRGLSEREANAIWKEALYNPKVANQITVAAKGGTATPMQLQRMHNYALTVAEEDAAPSLPALTSGGSRK